jgi:hypothetical protein
MRRKILERLAACDVKWVKKYLRKKLLKSLQNRINTRAKVASMLSENALLSLEFLAKFREAIITKNFEKFLLLYAEIAFTLRREETKSLLIKSTMRARASGHDEVAGILFELFLLFETSDEDDHAAVAHEIILRLKKLIVAGSPILIEMLKKYIEDNQDDAELSSKLIKILRQFENADLDKSFAHALSAVGILAKGFIADVIVPAILESTSDLNDFIKDEEDLEASVKAVQNLAKVLEEACQSGFEENLPVIAESIKEIIALFLKIYLCQQIIPMEVFISMVVEDYFHNEMDLAYYRRLISELIETCEGINKENLLDSLETILLTVDVLIELAFKTAVNSFIVPSIRMVYSSEPMFPEKIDQDKFTAVIKKIEKLFLGAEKNGYKKTLKKVADLIIDELPLLVKAALFYYRQEIDGFINYLSSKENTQSMAARLKSILEMANEDPDKLMAALKITLKNMGVPV